MVSFEGFASSAKEFNRVDRFFFVLLLVAVRVSQLDGEVAG